MILLTEITIPEFSSKDGVFFILAGAPASGKSTLVNHIRSLNPQIKIFNSDDVRKLLLKKQGKEHEFNRPATGDSGHEHAANIFYIPTIRCRQDKYYL